jgi:hypothetical protein
MLYVGDRVASSTVTMRTAQRSGGLSIGRCTSLTAVLDGDVVDGLEPAGVGAFVAALRSGHLVLELENHRAADAADVRATYVIEIAIPDPHELEAVDRAFARNLARDAIATHDIDVFASAVESCGTARSYAGALADYAHGVLVKEGTADGGATLPFGEFPAKFTRALDELSDHADRPVAASVVGAARLNLNDVVAPSARSGDARLDGCLQTLRSVAVLEPVAPPAAKLSRSGVPLCPIDRDTHLVLTIYEALARERDGSSLGAYEGRADDGALSPQDRAKIRVLLALGAVQNGRRSSALRHLEALAHDADFQDWAQQQLEGSA